MPDVTHGSYTAPRTGSTLQFVFLQTFLTHTIFSILDSHGKDCRSPLLVIYTRGLSYHTHFNMYDNQQDVLTFTCEPFGRLWGPLSQLI